MADMGADMEVDMAADMDLDIVADMEMGKVADMMADKKTWSWTCWPTSTSTSTWKSNLVRELVTRVG